ncbi:hypothetical protein [Endozoicomonas sp. ONNA2]|uniref:hypothetical protein n=1 Tax=Endozoicomonas sp. ONNA2 TaxID=2828741 RepID=UPI002148AFD2|nr:hypothetical protein [Endozoicomonas sp. ONNA2]
MYPLQNALGENPHYFDKDLAELNPEAFEMMKMCGHTVKSIEWETESKFKVITKCNSEFRRFNSESCDGSMQFEIKQTGTRLYLGKVTHHERCPYAAKLCAERTGPKETFIFEDFELCKLDFNDSWQLTMSKAKESACTNLNKVINDIEIENQRALAEGFDEVPHSAPGLQDAGAIVKGIENLEEQFKEFFKQ